MFNWACHFVLNHSKVITEISFIFALCNLIVSTVFDIAFHGLLRIKLAGSRQGSNQPADVRIDGESSIDMDKVHRLFNNFD